MKQKIKRKSPIKRFKRFISISMSFCLFWTSFASASNQISFEFKNDFSMAYKIIKGNEQQTAIEFFNKIEKELPYEISYKLKKFFSENKEAKISAFDITEIQSEQKPGVRLTFKINNQVKNLDFIQDNSELKFKTPTGLKTASEIYYAPDFNANVNRNYVLPFSEVIALYQANPKATAEYIRNFRLLIMDIERLEYLQAGVKFEQASLNELPNYSPKNIWNVLLTADNCWAADTDKGSVPFVGQDCVMGGYLTKYGKAGNIGLSCGAGDREISKDQSGCGNGKVPCNPLVYGAGFGASILCVSKVPPQNVSKNCDNAYPINDESSIKIYLASVIQYYKKENYTGEKVVSELDKRINKGVEYCFDKNNQASILKRLNAKPNELKWQKINENEHGFKKGLLSHDKAACATLINRLISLKQNQTQLACSVSNNRPVIIVNENICQHNGPRVPVTINQPGGATANPAAPPAAADEKKDDNNWIGFAIAGAMIALVAWLHHRNKRNHKGNDNPGTLPPGPCYACVKPPVCPAGHVSGLGNSCVPSPGPTPTTLPPVVTPPAVGKPGEDGIKRTGSGGSTK